MQRGLAAGLRAQVVARRARIGAERADVHHAAHAMRAARLGEAARQLHVDPVEGALAAVQRRHQVDDGIGALHEAGEIAVVVDVGLHHLDGRQHQQVSGARRMSARHEDAGVGGAETLDQLLAQHAAEEAAATEDHDVCHDPSFAEKAGLALPCRVNRR